MRLLIHDANVLIDLLDMGLLDEAMRIPCAMETTDLVQHEIVDNDQAQALSRCIEEGPLSVLTSSIGQMSQIGELQSTCTRLTLADCSVVFHAQDREGIVLSGDGQLRKEAARKGLEVHSTPWLLDLMVAESTLSPSTAIEKLEWLMSINRRLPHRECTRLIEAWKRLDRLLSEQDSAQLR
jgi:hypothetical protein